MNLGTLGDFMHRPHVYISLVLIGLFVFISNESTAISVELDDSRDIKSLFVEHCYACHGPDEKARQAGLRFDQRDVALSELESGSRAIVPGNVEASELIRRIFSDDPDEMMPPPDFRKRLSAESKVKLAEWVRAGAKFDKHWSFKQIRKPDPPVEIDQPWPTNVIDGFILAQMSKADLVPSPEADRRTLIRRLSLDLRGLPPSLSELRRFVNREYEEVVDAMLASEQYGERMAQDWPDLARYGDTNGYHADSDRSMWLYRDYVISAFNRNKPFDRFIVENMAGDLVPGANDETRIASGFHRCVTFNEEGGADPDEFYVTYAVDRTNTMGQALLGLTVGCAQCHDHKYDPISQKEYYQLYAFFNSVDGEIGAGGQSGYHNKPLPPLMTVASAEHKKQLAHVDRLIADAESRFKLLKAKVGFSGPNGPLAAESEAWAESLQSTVAEELTIKTGLLIWLDAARLSSASTPITNWPDASGNSIAVIATGVPQIRPNGINGNFAVRLDGVHDCFRTARGGEELKGDFTIVMVAQFHMLDTHQMPIMWGEEAQGKRRALWKSASGNHLSFNGYSADVVGSQSFAKDTPAIAVVTKSGADNLVRMWLNGQPSGEGRPHLSDYSSTAITIGANNAGGENAAIDVAEVLIYNRELSAAEIAKVGTYLANRYHVSSSYRAAPAEVLQIAAAPSGDWTTEQRKQLFDYFVANVHPESRDARRSIEAELNSLRQERSALESRIPTTMVMVEMKTRKPAFVLMRGDFQQPTIEVEPNVPAMFPPLPANQPRNRLGLAQWLVAPTNPLVARVTVNRIWKQFFGTGLVKTMGDFGAQGERPSHPELLDWLAADFIENGWDVKRLQRMIVQSSTYRQSSRRSTGAVTSIDPENRLLSRAPRFRLAAEEIRDVALSVSGLMSLHVGGPSVKPYQPEGYLHSIGKDWSQSTGNDLHRRGLYTFWRRTMLYPSYLIFDAPSREFCTVNRPRTNTPLQALVTLNDPVYVEAARHFGERILKWNTQSDVGRLKTAFELATSRQPNSTELIVLQEALVEQRAEYGADIDAAKKLVGDVGPDHDSVELAAWMAMSNILLNLDETITRE